MKNMAEETKKPKAVTDEIATIEKDFDIYLGWIRRLENPDPVLRTEAAGRGIKLYDEVDRDAHASSVLQQRILAIVGKEWEIIPGKSANSKQGATSTDQDQLVADYVSSVLENCNFDQARQEILKAILYGFYNIEIIWKVENGNLVISKLIGKHPRRFVFTPERELHLITLQNMIEGEALPPRKFITFTYGDSDNPYGRGLGQRIWWPVWFKKNGIKFWMIFLEKFGMPTVKGKYPSGTDKAMQDRLMEAIEAIQTDTGIKIPDSMDIEFLEAARAGTASYESLCEYMDKQISKAVLGQTASTEGTPGKLGNDKLQGDVLQAGIEADADLLDGCFNDNLIKWIVDYNFPGVTVYPKIKTYAHAKPDLTAQSAIDKTLIVDIGLPVTKNHLYETYGIPVPQEDDELVVPKAASPTIPSLGQFAESQADDWRVAYMKALKPSLQNARMGALDEVEAWLRKQSIQPTETEFIAAVQGILGTAFSVVDRPVIKNAVADIYKAFRSPDPAAIVEFGGPDLRAMNFLSRVDSFYVSKFIQNPDAIETVKSFLSERYLQDGAGIFRRALPENYQAFRDLFGQKLADMEDYQVSRIIDTSVTRTQNWAATAQLHEAAVTELEVYEPTQECDFCRSMNGKIISVAQAFNTMTRQAGMSPDQYAAEMKAITPTVDNADALVAAGVLPPYHPHCHGIVIKRVVRKGR
jgi:phage gp29-like protein